MVVKDLLYLVGLPAAFAVLLGAASYVGSTNELKSYEATKGPSYALDTARKNIKKIDNPLEFICAGGIKIASARYLKSKGIEID